MPEAPAGKLIVWVAEQKMADPAFWSDQGAAQKVLQRRKRLESDLDLLKRLRTQEDDAKVLADWLGSGE